MGRPHGPAQLRAFMRRLKDNDGPIESLLDEASGMGDPAHAARALAAVAAGAPPGLRQQALALLEQRLRAIRREAQVAETLPEVLKQIGDDAAVGRLARPLLELPDGEALSHGIRQAAKVAPGLRSALFERALRHGGQEAADAKAVLRAAFTTPSDLADAEAWRTRIRDIPDDGLRIRLQAFLHHQVSRLDADHPTVTGSLDDVVQGLRATAGTGAERADLWRTVAADAARLEPLLDAATAEPLAMRAEALLAIGVQADRRSEGALAQSTFDTVAECLAQIEDPRLAEKLATARQRAGGGGPAPGPGSQGKGAAPGGQGTGVAPRGQGTGAAPGDQRGEPAPPSEHHAGGAPPRGQDAATDAVTAGVAATPATSGPAAAGPHAPDAPARSSVPAGPRSAPRDGPKMPSPTGHALALCNTYTGGVKNVHFRAAARAAALCAAFGLDLVLLGFPVELDEFVARTARESRVGGEAWIARLHEAGRVLEGPLDPSKQPLWERYTWIATSERPGDDRQVDLAQAVAGGPVCLVMGIGPSGLPKRVVNVCRGEYEITGHGIGLETATAMGILADRLAHAR